MEQDYNTNKWNKSCPNIDCRKSSSDCGIKYVFISSVLGDDQPGSSVAPKNGAYSNAIVYYEANGAVYIYSSEGVPVETNISDAELLGEIKKLAEEKADKSEIPTKLSQLLNDAGFITNTVDDLVNYYTKSATDSLLSNKADKSQIPTKVSQLENDRGYITNTVSNLLNYYTKSQTYNKDEVLELISHIQGASFEVVSELPETGESNVIYLVPRSSEEEENIYDEYIYVNNAWELIGSTDVDMSNYYTKDEVDSMVPDNIRDGEGDLSIEANQDSIAIGKWAFAEGRGQTFEVEITAVDSANNQITVTDVDGIIRKNALLWIFDSNADGAYYFVKSVSGSIPNITLTLDTNEREIKDGSGTVIRTHYLSNVTTGTTITGYMGVAGASASHTEGVFNNTAWLNSETEKNEINVNRNHAEGSRNIATGYTAHAEGEYTEAIGNSSHAEGSNTVAQGHFSHAEGNATQAIGDNSHASGENTIAGYDNQTVVGRYNKNSADSMFEVGNGTSGTRKNVFSVNKDGSLIINDEYPFQMTDITPERVLDSRIYGGLYRVGFKYNLGDSDSEYGEVLTIPYIGSAPNYNPYSAQIFFPNGDSSNNKNNFWYRTCQGKLNGQPNWNAWVKVTPKDYLKGVSLNGTALTPTNGVVDIPIPNESAGTPGVVKTSYANGVQTIDAQGSIRLVYASDSNIDNRAQPRHIISPYNLDYAVKAAMTDGVGTAWTDAEKAAAKQRMGVPNMEIKSGTTNPTTSTSADYIGQLYYNSDKKYWFECTAITSDGATPPTYTYTWNRIYLESLSSGIVIGNPRTEQEGTINIGEGKSISSGTGGRWSTCIGYANSCASNYGLALGGSVGANANGAIQLGTGTNSTPSTFNVGFQGGSNYQMLDANGKIPNARLHGWRKLYEHTIASGEETQNIDIDVDLNNNSFELSDFKVYVLSPIDTEQTQGYIRLKENATDTGNGSPFGIITFSRTTYENQVLVEGHASDDFITYCNIGNGIPGSNLMTTGFSASNNPTVNFSKIGWIRIGLNASTFKEGTYIIVTGKDK